MRRYPIQYTRHLKREERKQIIKGMRAQTSSPTQTQVPALSLSVDVCTATLCSRVWRAKSTIGASQLRDALCLSLPLVCAFVRMRGLMLIQEFPASSSVTGGNCF